jgi:TrmH family RNA methyltransferase
MPVALINSVNNFRVLQWGKLKNKTQRDRQGLFIVEGYHLVLEAYKANRLVELITLEKNTPFDVPTFQVTYDVMEKLTSMATPAKLLGICAQQREGECGDVVLLADQIHHPGNLGTIIRSAVAFDVDTIVLENSADVYNQKVIQGSQGMIFHINIIKKPLKEFLVTLIKQKYQIIGTDVNEGIPLQAVKASKKRAVLIGNESDGVSGDLLKLCDVKLHIKMNEKCESLNVGVAAGIILHGLSC